MTDRKKSGPANYEVGYCCPPQATRFTPGKSGNPTGRPKGTRPVGAILQDIMGKRVSVTENGKERRIPTLEVILRRLANDAMRSNQGAIKLLLSLVDRYGDSPEATLQLRDLLAEDQDILTQYFSESGRAVINPSPSEDDKNHDNSNCEENF